MFDLKCPNCGSISEVRRVVEINAKLAIDSETGCLIVVSAFDTVIAVECTKCDADLGENALDNFEG